MRTIKKIWNVVKRFTVSTVKSFCRKVWQFVTDMWRHWAAAAVLVLASYGLTALLSEIPFYFSVPMWIEGPLVIPVIAVLLIGLLVKVMEHNNSNQLEVAI